MTFDKASLSVNSSRLTIDLFLRGVVMQWLSKISTSCSKKLWNKTLKNALDTIIKQFKEKTGQRTTYENVILRLIARDEYLMKFGIDSGVKEILGISE